MMRSQKRLLGHSSILVAAIVAGLAVGPARAEPAPQGDQRKPKSEAELRAWMENMVWYHGFDRAEIQAATGLSEQEIDDALSRLGEKKDVRQTSDDWRKAPHAFVPRVFPWPGGRAVSNWVELDFTRQRETKFTVFTPWDPTSYVVLDVPEAIWSQFGLIYLAHVHVPTIWTERNVTLEKLEWRRRDDGGLELTRRLPNDVVYEAVIVPQPGAVRMKLALTNGTDGPLTDLRVQNCIFLKGFKDMDASDPPWVVSSGSYTAYPTADGARWVVTAWVPTWRTWNNPHNPCFHSDPVFEDCPAGQTRVVYGWLSFHEGREIQREFARIDATGWKTDRWQSSPSRLSERE
ncbi:MAG: hypothetical protein JW809_11555 [Pirellulales bacterium]|nr:hypothetical protein [Pirellulales bacterium]